MFISKKLKESGFLTRNPSKESNSEINAWNSSSRHYFSEPGHRMKVNALGVASTCRTLSAVLEGWGVKDGMGWIWMDNSLENSHFKMDLYGFIMRINEISPDL